MRKEYFEEGQFYHIYNRGVDKRRIFSNDRERLRFINSLYILNNFIAIPARFDLLALEPRDLLFPIQPYVEVVAGCLMPNHYHLMLTPKQKGGISKFLQKVGSSHTHYFNLRHQRTGRLFESTFKAKYVDRHEYASYLTQYIHLNALDLYRSKIGTKNDTDEEEVFAQVAEYPWSTLPIYLGKASPFSLLVSANFRNEILDIDAHQYLTSVKDIFTELYRS